MKTTQSIDKMNEEIRNVSELHNKLKTYGFLLEHVDDPSGRVFQLHSPNELKDDKLQAILNRENETSLEVAEIHIAIFNNKEEGVSYRKAIQDTAERTNDGGHSMHVDNIAESTDPITDEKVFAFVWSDDRKSELATIHDYRK